MTRAPPLRSLVPDFGRQAPSRSSPAASSTQKARAFFGYRLPRTVSLILNTPVFGPGGSSRSAFKICASIAHLRPSGEAFRRAGWPRGNVLCDATGVGGDGPRVVVVNNFRRVRMMKRRVFIPLVLSL